MASIVVMRLVTQKPMVTAGLKWPPEMCPRAEIIRAMARPWAMADRKSTRLNSSHSQISHAAFCLIKKNLYTPGAFAYHDGMRLTEVIPSVDDLKPNADLHYVLIRRELPPDRRIVVLSTDLDAAPQ